MEVARTSMIHAAAPHFLWPFAVRYAAHQLNLWPCVSFPDTSPTLRWTGKVRDALVFRVGGSRAFVRDLSAHKLSTCAIPCVFLGFTDNAPGWQFYHLTSRYPLPGTAPVEVAVSSGAARGAASGGVEPGVAESKGAGFGGAEPGCVEPGGAESEGAVSGVTAGAGGTVGIVATGPGGARTRGTGAAGTGGVGGAGARDPTEYGAAGAGGSGAGGVGAGGAGAGGTGTGAGGARV
ncbi:unnamed protein product [Closterium sp. NIES-53]